MKMITFVAILVFLVHHHYHISITEAQFLYQNCYEAYGTYSLSSDYGTNIDTAITELASLASTTYFNSVSVGKGTDKVNALFSCRYDMTSDACQSCVASTALRVSDCFRSVESIQFYQECTFHYSNFTIFSYKEELPSYSIRGLRTLNDTTDDGKFIRLLSKTFTNLISDAVSEFSASSRYFATTTADYSSSETVYALAQCNEDLTSSDCNECLDHAFGNFTVDFPGAFMGQVFMPSCTFSYMLSAETMTSPYDFTVPLIPNVESPPPATSPDDGSTPAPESSPDSPTTAPVSPDDAPTTPDSPEEDSSPPFSFEDLNDAPSPPGLKPSGSTGTRGMSTTTVSVGSLSILLLLCFGQLL